MRVGIDASSIRAGGGLTHLAEILRTVQPEQHGIESITVWGSQRTIKRLPQQPWLHLVHDPLLDGSIFQRILWQHSKLERLAERHDVLFVPGGTYIGSSRPFVTMSQNLLPFEPDERRRFGLSWVRLRYHLLELSQTATFRHAAGIIFLTEAARQVVERRTGFLRSEVAIVPHGVAEHFRHEPRVQKPLSAYSLSRPFRWLYVSIVNLHKHQWHVVEAVSRLRRGGIAVALDLVGPAHPLGLSRLQEMICRVDPAEDFIHYHGSIPYSQLAGYYHQADGFVFASSCETFGQILLEAMTSGLPIACSERSAMPEILRDAGVYCDPEDPPIHCRSTASFDGGLCHAGTVCVGCLPASAAVFLGAMC